MMTITVMKKKKRSKGVRKMRNLRMRRRGRRR
jgi:hypothetical protein